MKFIAALLMVGLVLPGCSGSSDDGTGKPAATATIAVPSSTVGTASSEAPATESTTTTAPGEAPTSTEGEAEPEVGFGVVEFVGVLGELMEDTEYEDALMEDPEVFVATGLLFCERLDNGSNPVDLLAEYLATLHDGDVADAPDEVLDLSGWLLGTAVGYLCPQHTELLERMNQ